jgi:uncharacterized protein YbjT (DUF2867 family)
MYVITGATGHTGSIVAEKLLAKGEKVRVIGRDSKRLEPLVRKGAEASIGRVEDTAALTKAFSGARAVYAMIPPAPADPDPLAHSERVGESLTTALRESGVRHVVVLSSIGADKPDKTGPVLGLRALEQKISRISSLNALFLRPAYFLENMLPQIQVIQQMGNMLGPLRADLKYPMIATRDIGNYAADALFRLEFTGQRTQELLGAADRSYEEAAAIIGKTIGNPGLAYMQVPPEQLRPALVQMGMSSRMVDLLLEMSDSINNGYMAALEKRSPQNTTPTTLEQFISEIFAPAFKAKAASA